MTTKRTIQMMLMAVLAVFFGLSSQAIEVVDTSQDLADEIPSIEECLYGYLDEYFESFLMASETEEAESIETIRVAVVDFASATGESFTSCDITVKPMDKAGPLFSEAVASRISDWSEYEIVDRDDVARVIKKHKLSKKGLASDDSLRKLSELLDVQLVLVGQTEGTAWSGKGHAGGSLYASIQMLSAVNADVLWSIDGSVTDVKSTRQLIPSLADDMTGRLYAEIQAVESVQSMLALHSVER
ncbi:MAG: hypothetical protein ISS35_05475 [Kiritimatiellae bacterium]|nr:hypothetical protein [Kiritimatiellia bacterium]